MLLQFCAKGRLEVLVKRTQQMLTYCPCLPPPPPPALVYSRLEVAQRLREMKLMTQPGVGPLAPVTKGAAAAAAAAASLTETLLPSNKLEGDPAVLEHQISLLSARITSIANHLEVTKGAMCCCGTDCRVHVEACAWRMPVYLEAARRKPLPPSFAVPG